MVAYPSAERHAIAHLASDQALAKRVTLMIDSAEQLDLIESLGGDFRLRVCIDLDASLKLMSGRLHIGTRRSPLYTADEAAEFARQVVRRSGVRLVGLMAYEGQIAGVGDAPRGRPDRAAVIRGIQRLSARELAVRRADVVAAVREVAELEFVNGGGTGSLETTSQRGGRHRGRGRARGCSLRGSSTPTGPSRRARPPCSPSRSPVDPAPGIVTVAGGGWVASGPPGT